MRLTIESGVETSIRINGIDCVAVFHNTSSGVLECGIRLRDMKRLGRVERSLRIIEKNSKQIKKSA